MAAPTIESHNHSISNGGTTTTIAVTAAGSGRAIVICTTIGNATGTDPNPTLTIAGGGASVGAWFSIGNMGLAGAAFAIQAWYAITTGSVSAQTVTITSNHTIDDAATAYVTVAGANTTQPLDQNSTLATGASNGSGSWNSHSAKSVTISTNTANVLAFAQFGTTGNESYASPLANSTLTESAINSGGVHFAATGVYTAPFTATQSSTAIGSSATTGNQMSALAFAITADAQGGGGGAQARAMVMA